MTYNYPHTIENSIGQKLIFTGEEKTSTGVKVFFEGFCNPGSGPAFHTHFMQDEELTVVSGKMGYQYFGKEPEYLTAGESVLLKRGSTHKFWAEGEHLHAKGWVSPANSFEFFMTVLYAAQNKSGKVQPETFDGAYLTTRYRSEYDIPEIPAFVKKTIVPFTYFIGRLLGKYKNFKNAPTPIK